MLSDPLCDSVNSGMTLVWLNIILPLCIKALKVANFDLCSAAIEQWKFISEPLLLWHGASVYNGNLQRPVTLTHVA